MHKILIVEDSKTAQLALRSFVKKIFEEGTFDVKFCNSGEEALEVFPEYKPTFMTVDVIMPGGIDGIELTKMLEDKKSRTRIIIVSSQEYELKKLQKDIGLIVKAVIKKPVTKEKFRNALITAGIIKG